MHAIEQHANHDGRQHGPAEPGRGQQPLAAAHVHETRSSAPATINEGRNRVGSDQPRVKSTLTIPAAMASHSGATLKRTMRSASA